MTHKLTHKLAQIWPPMTEQPFTPGPVFCNQCAKLFTQDQPWKMLCLPCYLKKKGATATPFEPSAPSAAPISPDMLRRLIQLCHPDKHGDSEASNTATRYLLALKALK